MLGFLAFLLPLPAARNGGGEEQVGQRRRRALQALRLSPHLLQDVGMEAAHNPADDPRWIQRKDLER
ncbi:hypothetical protein [Devosia elaeis]|jgi:hypothetical protein|uniref:Uncharacterized protein n=1 Tax=Devosia elaeis TaxID=1770058 RepID=A0A178HXF7_9HYPH|nr:hypothetical protein [Devosia elaeis]OAM76668.1 hypothetical protein A3840_12000 [Devosia elaeis]